MIYYVHIPSFDIKNKVIIQFYNNITLHKDIRRIYDITKDTQPNNVFEILRTEE